MRRGSRCRRALDALSGDANQAVVREAVSELALRRLWTSNKRRRRKRLMIDVDGLPVQVHGQQPGSEYHGYYQQRMYHALVASCAESGDLIDGTLRPGAAGSADGVGRRGTAVHPDRGRALPAAGV